MASAILGFAERSVKIMKIISWLKITWNLYRVYKKLSDKEKEEFMEILKNRDDIGMEFFLRHHWKEIS